MKKMTRLNVSITYEQKLWLAQKAQEDGSTCTGVLRDLIRKAMRRSNSKPAKEQ